MTVSTPLPATGAASDLSSDSFIEIGRFNIGRHSGLDSAPAEFQSPTKQWQHDVRRVFGDWVWKRSRIPRLDQGKR
jgi:hypothetical protein